MPATVWLPASLAPRPRARTARVPSVRDVDRPAYVIMASALRPRPRQQQLAVLKCMLLSSSATGMLLCGAIEITAGPSLLWANVGQLQEVIARGTGFVVGAPLLCRVVDAPYDGTNFCPYCRSAPMHCNQG